MKCLLVVDSDWTAREMFVRKFGKSYELVFASTAARGLELAMQRKPDLAILECLLPDLAGVDLLRQLKSLFPSLPVVMTAPYVSQAIRASVLAAGAQRYLAKPIDMSGLRESVDGILSFQGFEAVQKKGSGSASLDQALIDNAVRFIEQHYAESVSLSQVAGQIGISKFALCRKFKKARGISFRDHLIYVRLTRARELLAQREFSVTQIAQMVGFSDLPRFDKVFKRATGLSPSAHRRITLTDSRLRPVFKSGS